MEVANCGACQHPSPIHVGARGRCRLNGCPCQGLAAAPATGPATMAVVAPGPVVSVEAFTAILTGIGFCLGLLLGLNL